MKNKINAVVFSSDNAAQLSLFLESINKYALNVFDLNVIINVTNEKFNNAYNYIINDEKFNNVNFEKKTDNFKEQVLTKLKTKHEYSCFFIDDNVFYNKVNFEDIDSQLKSDDDIVCFSLRLGNNTTKCYTLGVENIMHNIIYNNNVMKWDWTLHYLDFGYPFSTEGHVYRTKDIYKLSKKSIFSSAHELEMALFDYTETFPRNMMVSYKKSALVGIPAGRVQQSIEDETEILLKESEARIRREKMNELFLENKFIKLESLDFSKIEGCHQKIKLVDFNIESSIYDKVAIRKYGKRFDEINEEEQNEVIILIKKTKK